MVYHKPFVCGRLFTLHIPNVIFDLNVCRNLICQLKIIELCSAFAVDRLNLRLIVSLKGFLSSRYLGVFAVDTPSPSGSWNRAEAVSSRKEKQDRTRR